MSATTEERWQKAFKAVREQFEIDNLPPEQENALREFLGGQNIFVNLPTGYGKSLIFHCLASDHCGCSVRKASWFQCSRCHIAVAIADGRPDSACKQHGSASDRDYWRRGRRNNPAGYDRQLFRLGGSKSSLVPRLFSSASNFSVCSISDRRFFSYATQFLQTYLFSVDRKDISKLSISERTSNCFHPFESNTLSFLFSMTRQHKLQYMDESDMALSTFSNAKQGQALNEKTIYAWQYLYLDILQEYDQS